ncbi:MAG: DUF3427 domain-containing protein [Micrococcaceae bacterium]
MTSNVRIVIADGFNSMMIDDVESRRQEKLMPQFIDNQSPTIFDEIEKQITECNEFKISVAFITLSGVQTILGKLTELKEKGISGQILTSDYLLFTEPEAIRRLDELDNVEVRVFETNKFNKQGFHAKTYAFYYTDHASILLGSSNLTGSGLRKNVEWNNKLYMHKNSEYLRNFEEKFNKYWNHENITKVSEEWLKIYEKKFLKNEVKWKTLQEGTETSIDGELVPNSMQQAFIDSLAEIKESGKKRALLISATGSGKTYAAAFAVRELGFKKILFLVHRETIVDQAIESFADVFNKPVDDFGKLVKVRVENSSGEQSEVFKKEFVFGTVQTASKQKNYEQFQPDYFDLIIIDEAHRVAASSYEKILDYFSPDFLLGLTATPERTDNPEKVYDIFDHNIAGEVRLKDALEEELVCTFHYYGIADLEYREEDVPQEIEHIDFRKLLLEKRTKHIIENAEKFKYSGKSLKGLVFCSTKQEAKELADEFNKQSGYNTIALTGEDKVEVREEAIKSLRSDEEGSLQYIFTVDVFNEGVDIPEVNQILMVRPTESAIIFVQQLGRGLRKAEDKDFVVVIDFIGNYENDKKSYLIPTALVGRKLSDKDGARRTALEANKYISGESTVWFDEISKDRIFAAIAKMSFSKKDLQKDYFNVKTIVGKIPSLLDLYAYGEYALSVYYGYFAKQKSKGPANYFEFVKETDPSLEENITREERIYLEIAEQFLGSGKRSAEIDILNELLVKQDILVTSLNENCKSTLCQENNESAINLLSGKFFNNAAQKARYKGYEFIVQEGDLIKKSGGFSKALKNESFKRFFEGNLELAAELYETRFSSPELANFKLFERYSRRDVAWLLNNVKDDSSTMYGYPKSPITGYWPIFVTYKKADDVDQNVDYNDRFLNREVFLWESRASGKKLTKAEERILSFSENKHPFLIFVQKDSKEQDFYFVGASRESKITETIRESDKKAILHAEFKLEESVRDDVYDYLTS